MNDCEQQLSDLGQTQLKVSTSTAEQDQKSSVDFQPLIDTNEQLYKLKATEWLKRQEEARALSLEQSIQSEEKKNNQTVISMPKIQDLTCRNFANQSTYVTACCLNGDLMLVGTSAG